MNFPVASNPWTDRPSGCEPKTSAMPNRGEGCLCLFRLVVFAERVICYIFVISKNVDNSLIFGRGLNTYTQTTGSMSGDSEGTDEPAQSENSRDEIIRKRSFSRARGIDISTFMVDVEEKPMRRNRT